MKYHKLSFIVTIIGLILAYFWGERANPGSGLVLVFLASVLAILEVSLSFDNAVVNAVKLEKMSPIWQKRFLTWGMLIAVFGMRLVFPIVIVAVFAGLGVVDVAVLAVNNPEKYSHYLHESHASIAAFGGIFLLLLFLSFIFDQAKKIHWIKVIEEKLVKIGKLEGIEIIIALLTLYITQNFVENSDKLPVVLAGISGLITYLLIDGLVKLLEHEQESKQLSNAVKQGGFMSFMYLEIIDASFSFDGVMGAFAISKDVLIICIGLTIGAMFVRSITIMLVEQKTLAKYIYLEHGAHWAIGALAFIMLYSTHGHVSEVITGLVGAGFIGASYLSSLYFNKIKANESLIIKTEVPELVEVK
jgi:hypothetical protein